MLANSTLIYELWRPSLHFINIQNQAAMVMGKEESAKSCSVNQALGTLPSSSDQGSCRINRMPRNECTGQ